MTRPHKRCWLHHNSLDSILWGILITIIHVYLASTSVGKIISYSSLPWPGHVEHHHDLVKYGVLVGVAVILIPFTLLSHICKTGNLASDGGRMSYSITKIGIIRHAWHHVPPLSSLLHLLSSFCFLLPHALIDARLVQAGFYSRGMSSFRSLLHKNTFVSDNIWHNDLHWVTAANTTADNLVCSFCLLHVYNLVL